MFKKFSLFVLCSVLMSCASGVATKGGVDASSLDMSEVNVGSAQSFRVGMLLPLSGPAAKHGQGLKNATLMALDDAKNPNLILQFYDTKSTDVGARIAAENAINQKSKVIIGPLMSGEVKAITETTTDKGIPVIAFSTSQEVLQPGIYTLGLLVDEQVNRIISYAAQNGRSKLALLLPDTTNGIAVAKATIKAAQNNNIQVTRIAFFSPDTTDFSDLLKKMTDFEVRKGRAERLKNSLSTRAEAGDANSQRVLNRLKTIDSIGEVEFDMVLIPETGARLKSAISMFGYYDVFYPQVQFLGTAIWENSNLNNESTIRKAWYPTLSRTHSTYFANKYNNLFEERPNSLYSFAYDGVALASALSKKQDKDLTTGIVNQDGYIGINGVFRLFENGYNQHSLDIMEVNANGDMVIDAAPKRFMDSGQALYSSEIVIDENFKSPLIFGKEKDAAEIAIFGRQLPYENQYSRYISPEREKEIIAESLSKVKVVLP